MWDSETLKLPTEKCCFVFKQKKKKKVLSLHLEKHMESTTYGSQDRVQRRATKMIRRWNTGVILEVKGTEILKPGGGWLTESHQIYEGFLCRGR